MTSNVVSMTGFGRASATLGSRTLCVEIRSLNHRGLDIKLRAYDLHLAPEIETEILQLVRQRLTRGSVAISVRSESTAGQGGALDRARVREIHAALESVRDELGIAEPVGLATVGAFLCADGPGAAAELPASCWPDLLPTVVSALDGLLAMRAREGAAMLADLGQRLTNLRDLIEDIAKLAAAVPGRAARRFEERLAALTAANPVVEPARLAQEVAFLAERLDVSEEIARLRAHVALMTSLLADGAKDSPGRRIDFVAQEIGRELNTLGGKIQDPAISALVIDGKAELEKLREQAQNIE